MLSTISEEGLSPQAKALLILLKWAEKERAPYKELHKDNKTCARSNDVRGDKNNTNRSSRETSGTLKLPAHAEAGI